MVRDPDSWNLPACSPALPAGNYAVRRKTVGERWGARAIIIVDEQVVLVRHCYAERNEAYFLFPGGGSEIGETIAEAAARECSEETGLIVEVESLLYIREACPGDLEFYVLARPVAGMLALGRDPEKEQQVLAGITVLPLSQIGGLHHITLYPRTLQARLARDHQQGWPRGLYLGAVA